MASTPRNAPFTQAVVEAMRSLYPEEVADRAWDNVGLLLGNIDSKDQPQLGLEPQPRENTVLLTNDLTPAVAQEAVREKASVIVSYHPIIFRGLKAINLEDPQQRILLQLAQSNIAVYCPHTAVDAVPGGLNDWLADILCGGPGPDAGADADAGHKRSVVQPTSSPPPAGFEGSGYGRLVEFGTPVGFADLVRRLAAGLGGLRHVMVAVPRSRKTSAARVRSAAVCAGSGWDVLRGCDADVLVTGEMSHHNALRATMEGRLVVTAFHSNSERAYLRERMRPALEAKLAAVSPGARVLVSTEDADPFEIWDVRKLP